MVPSLVIPAAAGQTGDASAIQAKLKHLSLAELIQLLKVIEEVAGNASKRHQAVERLIAR